MTEWCEPRFEEPFADALQGLAEGEQAMATDESAAAAHVSPDAELIKEVWQRLTDLEDDLAAIREFSDAIISLGVEVEGHDGKLAGAIIRIAREIDARVDVIGAAHGKLFRLLHPTCHCPVDDDRDRRGRETGRRLSGHIAPSPHHEGDKGRIDCCDCSSVAKRRSAFMDRKASSTTCITSFAPIVGISSIAIFPISPLW